MLRNQQLVLLYLQFLICNVFTFNIKVLSKEVIQINDTNNITYNSDWKCKSNDECTATNSVCQNNLCQCESEYIFNADMTSCIKVATGLYDTCEETIQCSTYLLSGAKCINKVCVCGPGYYYLHGRCNRYVGLYEKCKQDVDCYVNADFEASVCDNGICKCTPGFYQREYRTCRREGKKDGDECTINNDCTFDNAICTEFVCKASQVEEAIELASDAMLTTNNSDANEEIRVDGNCMTNEDCRALGNAVCSPIGTCRCDRAHFASATGTECIPELGEPCQESQKGYIEKSFCRKGRWSCSSDTVASKNNRECLEVTREHNGNCEHIEQCYVLGPDALCNNKKCVCNEIVSHYIKSELFCWVNRGVEETCKHNRDCYVKDFKGELICKNNKCSCPDGTHLRKNKMACISDETGLGGICDVDDDCVTLNSVCKREVCSCDKNYYELNEKCLAGINSNCTNNEHCTPRNSVCVSNVCSCEPNYVSVATGLCMPLSSYDEPCSLDVQCSNISGAICASKQVEKAATDMAESPETTESKVCTCSEDSYYTFEQCFKKRFLGETCMNHNECYESVKQIQEKKIICKNGKCACDWGWNEWNSSVCVKHPEAAAFYLNSSTINVISTGLFSIILLYIFL
ncbi:hypothetical protein DMN91_001616 [Ooceraea biroi]|uniref:EB domain-containing protein n=1 Tax=Ooceraea biroi TaxID=2015173 RepID=A0A3L8DYB7_OOCBI|nr:fibrillin-1-like [Ooceraea biroi]RLU25460.1 hypothetical protein DMN91_001616 [Ooceraea biroi]